MSKSKVKLIERYINTIVSELQGIRDCLNKIDSVLEQLDNVLLVEKEKEDDSNSITFRGDA